MKLETSDIQKLKVLTDNINKLTTTNKTNRTFIDNLKKRLEIFTGNIPKLNEGDYLKIYKALNADYINLKNMLNKEALSLHAASAAKKGRPGVPLPPTVAKRSAVGVTTPRSPLPVAPRAAKIAGAAKIASPTKTMIQNVAKEAATKKVVAAVTHTGSYKPALPPLPAKFTKLGNDQLYPQIQAIKKKGRADNDYQYIPELEKRLEANDRKIVSDLTAAMQSQDNQYQYNKWFSKETREKQSKMLKFLANAMKSDMDPIAKTLLAERVLTVLNNDLRTESRTWDRQSKLAAIVERLQLVVKNTKDRLPGYEERKQDKTIIAAVNHKLEEHKKDLPELTRAVEKSSVDLKTGGMKVQKPEEPTSKGRKPGR